MPRDANGVIDAVALDRWIDEVRVLCKQHGRGEIGDERIGQLLAREPAEDSQWPPEPVVAVIERCGSRSMASGLKLGAWNSRGVFTKTEAGGDQERDLAARYRAYAQHIEYRHPFAARIIAEVADSYDEEALREDEQRDVRSPLR